MKVAIHENKAMYDHSTSWCKYWVDYCKYNNIDYELVNCYATNIINKLSNFDILLWHFKNYSLHDMLFARSILNSAKNIGLKVFPDFNTSWHFDDKIAEYYLLQTVDAPIPSSWVFYTKEESIRWLKAEADYPLVAKLRSGSGSNNVKLLKNQSQAISYTNRMFKNGYKNVPSLFFKVKTNVKSSKDWEMIVKRFDRIPDFINSLSNAKMLPRERGYVYFQEFVPNDGYDLKIFTVGSKLTFVVRNVRKGDFRASGSASFSYNKKLVSPDIINWAFSINEKLKFQSMGYDFVVDNRTNSAKIVEISYGNPPIILMEAGGYWDKERNWHEEPLNVPAEVLINLLT